MVIKMLIVCPLSVLTVMLFLPTESGLIWFGEFHTFTLSYLGYLKSLTVVLPFHPSASSDYTITWTKILVVSPCPQNKLKFLGLPFTVVCSWAPTALSFLYVILFYLALDYLLAYSSIQQNFWIVCFVLSTSSSKKKRRFTYSQKTEHLREAVIVEFNKWRSARDSMH